jgi:hypothetical protein
VLAVTAPAALADVTGVLDHIWRAATTRVPAPSRTVVIAMALVAVAVVLVTPVWRVARNVITIAHESAHALTALLTGRRLTAIRLHSDTSGLTVSAGKPRGFGMILTTFAGYVGPALVGLGAAWLLRLGYAVGLLWLLVVLLLIILVKVRNWYGLLVVLVSAGALVGVGWYAPPATQSGLAYALTWFLLFGAVRPVAELQATRHREHARGGGRGGRRTPAGQSDADQLARLTHLPGLLWVVVFAMVTVGAAALAAHWIGPWWHS